METTVSLEGDLNALPSLSVSRNAITNSMLGAKPMSGMARIKPYPAKMKSQ